MTGTKPNFFNWSMYSAYAVWEVACLIQGIDPKAYGDIEGPSGVVDLTVEIDALLSGILAGEIKTAIGQVAPSDESTVITKVSLIPWLCAKGYDELALDLLSAGERGLLTAPGCAPNADDVSQKTEGASGVQDDRSVVLNGDATKQVEISINSSLEDANLLASLPGEIPHTAVGKIAVLAAYSMELSSSHRPEPKSVYSKMREWAKAGFFADVLNCDESDREIYWVVTAGARKKYSLRACGKCVKNWWSSIKTA